MALEVNPVQRMVVGRYPRSIAKPYQPINGFIRQIAFEGRRDKFVSSLGDVRNLLTIESVNRMLN